jgi:hypothetical protein
MGLARALIITLAILGLSTASFAGDLQESIAKAAQQQENSRADLIPPNSFSTNPDFWPRRHRENPFAVSPRLCGYK